VHKAEAIRHPKQMRPDSIFRIFYPSLPLQPIHIQNGAGSAHLYPRKLGNITPLNRRAFQLDAFFSSLLI
jgi:hypothetical protein